MIERLQEIARRKAMLGEMLQAAGEARTYEHVTPYHDEPTDHHEGGCSCGPFVDETTRTVFHRPLSRPAETP